MYYLFVVYIILYFCVSYGAARARTILPLDDWHAPKNIGWLRPCLLLAINEIIADTADSRHADIAGATLQCMPPGPKQAPRTQEAR